jgi:hypothetical protein
MLALVFQAAAPVHPVVSSSHVPACGHATGMPVAMAEHDCCPTGATQSCCQLACAVSPGLLDHAEFVEALIAAPATALESVALPVWRSPPPTRPPILRA